MVPRRKNDPELNGEEQRRDSVRGKNLGNRSEGKTKTHRRQCTGINRRLQKKGHVGLRTLLSSKRTPYRVWGGAHKSNMGRSEKPGTEGVQASNENSYFGWFSRGGGSREGKSPSKQGQPEKKGGRSVEGMTRVFKGDCGDCGGTKHQDGLGAGGKTIGCRKAMIEQSLFDGRRRYKAGKKVIGKNTHRPRGRGKGLRKAVWRGRD